MNKTYLISFDTIKTIAHGAAGAISFGIYHQYSTDKHIKLMNENKELQQQYFIDKLEAKYNKEIHELKEKINTLEQHNKQKK